MMDPSGPATSVATRPLHVPRLLRQAEVVCVDGRVMRGRVFLPAGVPPSRGAVPVSAWIEEAPVFFPFLPDGEGRPVLVNKEQLLMLTVSTADAGQLPEPPVPRRRVRVDSGALEVEGEIAIQMPPTHSRVLDVLNGPGSFLLVVSGPR